MPAIDIGSAAIDRVGTAGGDATYILANNPANFSGKITEIQVYVAGTGGDNVLKVAIFQSVGGNIFTARDSQSVVVTGVGLNILAVNLDVISGDYIGFYGNPATADIYLDLSASGAGRRAVAGDQTACVNKDFGALVADRDISLYGTGLEPPAISSLTPDSGPVDEEIIVDGTDFEDPQGTGGVTVDGIPADIISWTDTEIIITIPAGVACGDVDVVVTTAHGQISGAFTLNVECPSRRNVLQVPPIGWPISGQGVGRPPIMG